MGSFEADEGFCEVCCSGSGQMVLDCVPQAAVCLPGAGTGVPVPLSADAVSVSHQLSEVIVTMTHRRAGRAADLSLSEWHVPVCHTVSYC